MARDYPVTAYNAGVACLALAVIGWIAYAALLFALSQSAATANPVLLAATLLAMIGGSLGTLSSLLLLNEVRLGRNDAKWKAFWGSLLLLTGIVGAALYLSVARKDWKKPKNA